jgi:hypothetical protein
MKILNCNAFLQNFPNWQWTILMKLMWNAKDCFEHLVDSDVISHIQHAKLVVPLKTIKSPFSSSESSLNYYG